MNSDILLVGASFPMPKCGGSINYVYNILSELTDKNITIITAKGSTDNEQFDIHYPHEIIRTKYIFHVLESHRGNMIKRYIYWIISLLIVCLYIIRNKPKIILYTEFSPLCISAFFAKLFVNAQVGCFTYAEEIQIYLRKKAYNCLMRLFFRYSNFIITVCDFTKDLILQFGNYSHKIHKIIPPVNVIPIDSGYSKHHSSNKIIILTVARLEPRKGHLLVIECLSRLIQRYPCIEYNIIGTGPYEKEIISEIEKYDLTNYVHLLGRLSDEDLADTYCKADIFVMPHRRLENGDTEGCPTVFLEAGYYYLPVIGGSSGGVKDAIINNKSGYIIQDKSNELYAALDNLISSKELRESMGKEGHKYSSNFLANKQSLKFRKLIDSFININQ